MATSTPVLTQEELQNLLNGPAGTPPPGVIPNFHDPPNLNVYVIVTITLCVSSATLAVLIRMYTKLFLLRSRDYEDYTILMAWIGQIGQTIPSGLTTRYGVGVHIWNVQLKSFFKMLYWVDVAMIVYNPAIFLIKLSILLQYLRLFRPMKQGSKFLYFGVHIMLCIPRSKVSNPLGKGKCYNSNALLESTGIFNVVSNFALIILPIPSVWNLHIPMKKKVGVAAIFSAGFFACIASIIRTTYAEALNKSVDFTYNLCAVGLWTYAEISIGIIVVCLPVTPRFFQFVAAKFQNRFLFGHIFKSTNESRSDSEGLRNETKVPIILGPFDKSRNSDNTGSSEGSYHPQLRLQLQGDYYTLTEVNSMSVERDSSGPPSRIQEYGQAVTLSELESGRSGIRVERTIEVEIGPNTEDVRLSDHSGQRIKKGW